MGTLKLNTTSGGSVSIQAADGASDNTVTLPAVSGANIITSADSGTVTNAMIASGVRDNTPYFFGGLASNQTLTRNTWTKITTMTTGEVDSDSAFDGTTFTVPSGKGGIYYIAGSVRGNFTLVGSDAETVQINLYKNGSGTQHDSRLSWGGAGRTGTIWTVTTQGLISLSAGDYIELYANLIDADGSGNGYVNNSNTYLMGYKIN